ncbi:MAG: site-2 protease family protein [Candidatus Pacebacteria bacterium]|jgi:regulator of sigma E protease|nr:site-2 protease family protein [Candidatus Paceibacterota bacterium]
MAFLLLILVLSVLVLVHELGHLLVAKASGMKVFEFGFGFPPKLVKLFSYKGTDYTLNLIPFGGFVKIAGEDGSGDPSIPVDQLFSSKPKYKQFLVLIAGVVGNVVLGWILLAGSFSLGVLVPVTDAPVGIELKNHQTMVLNVLPESPAALAGIEPGVRIKALVGPGDTLLDPVPEVITAYVQNHGDHDLTLITQEGGRQEESNILKPVLDSESGNYRLGIALDRVGTYRMPIGQAIVESWKKTGEALVAITSGLFHLLSAVFQGGADLSGVAGPVGIAGMAKSASQIGLASLLSFMAILSLNLAILNLLPIPALDGGRIVIVALEAIIGRKITGKAVSIVQFASFALLILLMILVTVHDVKNLF